MSPTTRDDPRPATPDLDAVRVTTTRVVSGLDSPVALAWRADDTRMFVAEQTGRVRVVSADGKLSSTPLLTVGPLSTGNEEGLLGLAFSPDGTKLYVDYTDPGMDVHVDEYRMAGESVVPASRRQVLLVQHPFANHNGGELVFGPDGMLYMSIGDGGSAGDPQHNGQNLGTLLAKILRIDPAAKGGAPYSVPADNPFVGRAGARTETWMWGLRNPWRFSFDRATGDMWIGDVGQDNYEEVDFAPKGEKGINWGWSAREGLHGYHGGAQPPGGRDPILNTTHTDGNCAIVGGYVYRGRAIPALRGVYLFGDDCRTAIVGVVARRAKSSTNATSDRGSKRSPVSGKTRRASSTRSRATAPCSVSPRPRRAARPTGASGGGALEHCCAEPARDRVRSDRRQVAQHLVRGARNDDRAVLDESVEARARDLGRLLPHEAGDIARGRVGTLLELGVREAGTQHGDRDTGAPQLLVHGFGERGDEGLGRAVGRVRRARLETRERRDVEDATPAALGHRARGRMREPDESDHVQIDLARLGVDRRACGTNRRCRSPRC